MQSILPQVERKLSTLEAFRRVNTAVDSARTAAQEVAQREEEEARRTGASIRDTNGTNDAARPTGANRTTGANRSASTTQNAISQNTTTNVVGGPVGAINRTGAASRSVATTQGNATNQTSATRTSTSGVTTRSSVSASISSNDNATQRVGAQSSSATFRTPTLQTAQRTAQEQLTTRRSFNVLV